MKEDLVVEREQKTLYENLANMAVKGFTRRHINAQYFPSKEEALPKILDLIPEGAIVGTADSVTLLQVGVFRALKKRGKNQIINPFLRDDEGHQVAGGDKLDELMHKVLLADVFVAGTNAITMDGKVVNIDGGGNRVAPMIFGPRKVIIVVGANKIVKDVEAAIRRIKEFCAPMNAARHGIKHHSPEFLEVPCVKAGVCVDCNKPQRLCNFTTIIEGEARWNPGRMNVVIIGEKLGI